MTATPFQQHDTGNGRPFCSRPKEYCMYPNRPLSVPSMWHVHRVTNQHTDLSTNLISVLEDAT